MRLVGRFYLVVLVDGLKRPEYGDVEEHCGLTALPGDPVEHLDDAVVGVGGVGLVVGQQVGVGRADALDGEAAQELLVVELLLFAHVVLNYLFFILLFILFIVLVVLLNWISCLDGRSLCIQIQQALF